MFTLYTISNELLCGIVDYLDIISIIKLRILCRHMYLTSYIFTQIDFIRDLSNRNNNKILTCVRHNNFELFLKLVNKYGYCEWNEVLSVLMETFNEEIFNYVLVMGINLSMVKCLKKSIIYNGLDSDITCLMYNKIFDNADYCYFCESKNFYTKHEILKDFGLIIYCSNCNFEFTVYD